MKRVVAAIAWGHWFAAAASLVSLLTSAFWVPRGDARGSSRKAPKRFDLGFRRGKWALNTAVIALTVSKLFVAYLLIRVGVAVVTGSVTFACNIWVPAATKLLHGALPSFENAAEAYSAARDAVGREVFRARKAIQWGVLEAAALAPVAALAVWIDYVSRPRRLR